jgi:hypothetical protein
MIESVTLYKCPETGKLFDTAKKAQNSAKSQREKVKREEKKKQQEKEKEFRRNYIRLNAVSPDNAIELLREKSKEFWGIEFLSVRGGGSYSHGKGISSSYISLGSCELSASVVDKTLFRKYFCSTSDTPSISYFLGFIGFRTGSGCPGKFDDYDFRMDVRMELNQFPLIKKNWEKVAADRTAMTIYLSTRDNVKLSARNLSRQLPEYLKLKDLYEEIVNLSQLLSIKISEMENHNESEYIRLWEGANPPPKVNDLLLETFNNVR